MRIQPHVCDPLKITVDKKNLIKKKSKKELSDLVEHIFPPKITRRDALTLFSGFDKNANRKILGALVHIFSGHKI